MKGVVSPTITTHMSARTANLCGVARTESEGLYHDELLFE